MATLFASTSVANVINTITETSLFPIGTTITIPANYATAAGNAFRISLVGVYITTVTPPTLRIKIKLDSTVIIETGIQTALAASAASGLFEVSALLHFEATGVNGVLAATGRVLLDNGVTTASSEIWLMDTASITVDTTVSHVLDATATWGTASTGNTVKVRIGLVEVLDPA